MLIGGREYPITMEKFLEISQKYFLLCQILPKTAPSFDIYLAHMLSRENERNINKG